MIKILRLISEWLDNRHIPKIEGWCSVTKGHYLAAAVFTLRPQVAVEIGVFAGKSLLPVALAMKEVGQGKIIGIDPWLPAASAEGYDGANAEWWKGINHATLKRGVEFLIAKFELADFVEIVQSKSDDVEPPMAIDMLHVDGQHTAQAQRDVARFASKVRVGGLVFMDDVSWENAGERQVRQATIDLMKLGFRLLYSMQGDGNDWEVYQRDK